MIKVHKRDDQLVIEYETRGGASWFYSKLSYASPIKIKGSFLVESKDVLKYSEIDGEPGEGEDDEDHENEYSVYFRLGKLSDGYYEIRKSVLDITYDLFIASDIELTGATFIAERHVSVFKIIEKLVPLQSIYVGGSHESAIPKEIFQKLIVAMPNNYEIEKYATARVSSIVREFFETKVDGETNFQKYLNRKSISKERITPNEFRDFEIEKYKSILLRIRKLLETEVGLSEDQWQAEILRIILSIFPKYIKAIREAPVKDSLANTMRSIDIMLVDSSGNVDVIEIKKPFDRCIVTDGKYRGNHVPMKELSGSIMQVEKYIFHLNKWGTEGEKHLNRRYQSELPEGLALTITNPTGMIIAGRDTDLSTEQRRDFEIIRRKYSNIVDIITYDDLAKRLDNVVRQLESET